jgi:hypothetical protein
MIQVQESIVQLVSKLPLHRQFEVRNFAEFLLSREDDSEDVNQVNLAERGIDELEAADLRARLQAISEDWERPEMGAYDAL